MTQPTVSLAGGGQMPLLGFGTWQLPGSQAYDPVRVALDTGYRHLDTATMYRNEAEVGRALRDSGVPRDQVFVTTKLPAERAGRERETIEASLRALGVDQLDLWLVHWPPSGARPETWREFVAAREAGLTRAIGVSNYSIGQIDELIDATGVAPAVNQIPYSPALHDAKLLAEHRERGVVVEGYSPFRRSNLREPVFAEVARAHGVTPAQVILRWHIQHEIVVIPKSATPDRIKANFDVAGFELTPEEMARIDAV
ncbi:aldo/keto reductase [Micromonospora sp. CPCC 205371]|nr:aldo/keto reductase [Micromonospora sp. CPCC 205371]